MKKLIFTLTTLVLSLFIGALVGYLLGENPFFILQVMFQGAFGSMTNLGYSLFYATPLILTGLAVSFAFRTGLFNIGAEGQMNIGGITMAIVGIHCSHLGPFSLPVALLAGAVAGGLWGAIAGWLKAYRHIHEVLSTILLNFVSYGLVSYLVNVSFRNPDAQAPETLPILAPFQVTHNQWFGTSPLSLFILMNIILVFLSHLWLEKSTTGTLLRFSGEAPETARRAGIKPQHYIILTMFVSGAFAALASSQEILSFSMKAKEGFPAGAGFVGIAVALLGRNHPIGILLSSLLFGALHKGSLDLDIDTEKVSRDLAVMIQALIIIQISTSRFFEERFQWLKN